MRKPLIRARLAAVAAALAGVVASLLVAAPAQAGVWYDRDPVDRRMTYGDIQRVRVHHAERNVFVKVVFRRAMSDLLQVWIDTRPGRRGAEYIADIDDHYAEFRKELSRANGFRYGNTVRCAGLRASHTPGRRTVRMTIPRSCLGGPARLRASLHSTEETGRFHDWAPGRRQFARWLAAD